MQSFRIQINNNNYNQGTNGPTKEETGQLQEKALLNLGKMGEQE